jgi:hypothetical protein
LSKIIKLSKPIDINGKTISEIPYDIEGMTVKDKINAGKAMKAAGVPLGTAEELDPDYHLYLFAASVSRADSSIDITDVMRINAKDAQKGCGEVRNFFYLDSEDLSQTNTSEEQ